MDTKISRSKGAGGLAELIERQGGERSGSSCSGPTTAARSSSARKGSKKRGPLWKPFIGSSSVTSELPARISTR